VGEWRQIPGSALASAPRAEIVGGNSGPESKVIAWTGLAIDSRDSSLYSPANGGHWDYEGNEVNRIRLSDDAPKWTEPRAATPTSQTIADATHYKDGRPTSRHTYYGVMLNEKRNRIMIMAGASWGDGKHLSTMDGFNLVSNDWDPARTYPDVPAAAALPLGFTFVEQKATGDIYAFADWSVFHWSNTSNSWSTRLGSAAYISAYGAYAATAVDTRRNRILVMGGDQDDRHIYDIASNTMQKISFTGPNAGSLMGAGNGVVYDPHLDAFLLRQPNAGGTIYRVNAQSFYADTLATTAGSNIPATRNQVWRRFLYVPALKGIVYVPTYNGNVWFIRTS